MRLKDELPVDHHLATVYRWGAALCGCVLLVFGCLGFADALSPFDTSGAQIAGMTTNTALSWISVLTGLLLLAGAVAGGNTASTINLAVGGAFLLSGFYHLFVLDRPANFLDFGMTNVMFSFLMGLLILTFGMYGRVSSKLSHDNPYWRRRHPREAAAESLARRRRLAAASLPPGAARTTAPALPGSAGAAVSEGPPR
ncbi:DUF4383 domain-containing protein [Streptomyces showdoensis]|uniref:DUF4383 domain-containing protein n=1 Tax=Streptomyces showdoensis TaxID=68268 RepID=A0A2P2GFZ8_STREW|nr:DUF4383 domain-containing protein [Streptomyces showdoensis]KKZ70433.1 hypothetical protein VO63_29055 [Streptomyces showdoensis]